MTDLPRRTAPAFSAAILVAMTLTAALSATGVRAQDGAAPQQPAPPAVAPADSEPGAPAVAPDAGGEGGRDSGTDTQAVTDTQAGTDMQTGTGSAADTVTAPDTGAVSGEARAPSGITAPEAPSSDAPPAGGDSVAAPDVAQDTAAPDAPSTTTGDGAALPPSGQGATAPAASRTPPAGDDAAAADGAAASDGTTGDSSAPTARDGMVDGAASPAADGTAGNAAAAPAGPDAEAEPQTPVERVRAFLDAGGPAIWALAALSVATLALILWKIWRLFMAGAWSRRPSARAVEAWEAGRPEAALERLARRRGLRSRVARAAISARMNLPDAAAREETARVARSLLARESRGLGALELIATIAPLLGLLGTVLGMIAAFAALQEAGNRADPALLAGGIREALLTTAAGMAVAIPASAALTWFDAVIDSARADMEDLSARIFVAPLPGGPSDAAAAEAEAAGRAAAA